MTAEKGVGKGKNVKKGTKGFVSTPKKVTKAPSASPSASKAKASAVKIVKTGTSSPEVNLNDVAKLVAAYTIADFAKREKDPKKLDDLARNGNSEVLLAVAENPFTSDETLTYLLDSGNIDDKMLARIFDRKDSTLEMQRKVVYNKLMEKDDFVSAYILTRKTLNPELMKELAEYAIKKVSPTNSKRHSSVVDENQVVPGDRGFMARNISMNPSATSNILHLLSDSPNYAVRYNVALHKETYLEDINKLALDIDPAVASAAKQTIKIRKGKRIFAYRMTPTGWGALSGINL